MVIRFLLLSLFAVSCGGREVKFNNNNLESSSKLTQAEVAKYLKSGTVRKGTPSTVFYNGQTYTVSIYSSNNANTFIAGLPAGSQVPVKFTGGTNGQQIVLETVQRQ